MKLSVTMQEDDSNIVVQEQGDTLGAGMFDAQTVSPPPMDSPAFTGVPTAPTAPVNTYTTQIATTEFVMRAINSAHFGYGNVVMLNVDEVTS